MDDQGVIVVDWGTTWVRAWWLDAAEGIRDARRSDAGMGQLAGEPAAFAKAFDQLVAGWPDLEGVACGMVGARQGWQEAPYVAVPTSLDGLAARVVRVTSAAGRPLAILPGLCQHHPPDVMRGEETKLLGLVLGEPASADPVTVLLVGTHAKHVRLAGGTVQGFTTVPTGELFDVLRRHSILRLALTGDDEQAADAEAFAAAVRTGAALGAGELMAAVFQLRAASLLGPGEGHATRARLSGLLIGAELALLPPAPPPVLVATDDLAAAYRHAFAALERPLPRLVDGGELVLRGLAHVARTLVA